MRDYKLDFLRGAALMMIFCEHVPGQPFAEFTLQAISFSAGAEFFFFLSGLVAGRIYKRATCEKGWNEIVPKILRRTWSLYASQVSLAFIAFLLVALTFWLTEERGVLRAMRMGTLYDAPATYLPHLLTMTYQGRHLDILPLYVIFFFVLPLILVLAKRHILFIFIPSLLLYCAVLVWGWEFSTVPNGERWLFNPLSWQFHFLLGFTIGWMPRERFEILVKDRRTVTLAAAIALVLGPLGILTNTGLVSLPWLTDTFLTDKPNLGPIRILNFLALFVLLFRLLPSDERLMEGRVMRSIAYTGQHSLNIFMAGVVLCVLAHIVRETVNPGGFVLSVYMFAGLVLHPVLGTWLHHRGARLQAAQRA